jgi:hypothetical protein
MVPITSPTAPDRGHPVHHLVDGTAEGWDTQAIAMSVERARGKRAVGERIGGDGFVATASKTVAAGAEQVFMAFVDPSQRAGWLPDAVLSERMVSKPMAAHAG